MENGFLKTANNALINEHRQLIDGTYNSANLKQHCKEPIMTDKHSSFTYDPRDPGITMPHKYYKLLTTYREIVKNRKKGKKSIKALTQDTIQEILANKNKQHGEFLDRTYIHIFDSNWLDLAKAANPDHYKNLEEHYYNDTINNINPDDLDCTCKNNKNRKKILFEQILGKSDTKITAMAWGNCRHTIFAAAKRQLKNAPQPDPHMAQLFLQFAKDFIHKYMHDKIRHFGYSYKDWYNHLPKKKQQRMDKVRIALGLEPGETPTAEEMLQLLSMHYEGICKVEIQELDGKPRMVCAIPDLIKYTMGPITWQLEELFAESFPGYCGGKNLTQMEDEINDLIDMGFTKVVEGDGSGFDNTQDIVLKEVERYIYNLIAPNVYHVDAELFKYVANMKYKTMDIKITENKKMKILMTYHVLGTVFSGDCDTTFANTLRMSLYNHFTNYYSGLKLNKDYYLFSKGDDFSVLYRSKVSNNTIQDAYNKTFLPKITDQEDKRVEKLGQICKFLEIGNPDSFKFCSLRSWYKDDLGHITLTRNPGKFFTLAKYSRKIKSMNPTQRYNYILDQALALTQSYKGIQIFDTMANIYTIAARTINTQHNGTLKRTACGHLGDKRTIRRMEIDDIEDKYTQLYYNVKHRNKQYKIYDNYWDTMRYIEKRTSRLLTQQQLKIVNDQINMEFNPQELLALLAEIKK